MNLYNLSKNKGIRKKIDKEINCEYINNKCIQSCTCYVDNKDPDNILRIFYNYDLYKWEIEVYLKLLDSKIIPLITSYKYEISYVLKGFVSLRTFFNKKENKNNEKITLILNELYSFINTFKKYNFVHGNLHIDNIYIKKIENNCKITYEFKVIDYVNSYISNIKRKETYTRTSFLGEYLIKEDDNFLKYWDFFTVYISLKTFFKNKVSCLYQLQKTVEEYIPNNTFNIMLKETILSKQIFIPFQCKFFD